MRLFRELWAPSSIILCWCWYTTAVACEASPARADAHDEGGQRAGRELARNLRAHKASKNVFVHEPRYAECSNYWTTWPELQEKAVAAGTVIVLDVTPNIGNLFIVLRQTVRVVRLLEAGLLLRWGTFPGFRAAFDPARIQWDTDPVPFVERAQAIKDGSFAGDGLHALHFLDGLMILSDGQVETLGSVFSITDADAPEVAHRLETELAISKSTRGASIAKLLTHSAEARKKAGTLPQPCAWNMLLGRSATMVTALNAHRPRALRASASQGVGGGTKYVAWHMRTAAGETVESYNPGIHTQVLKVGSIDACPAYLKIMKRTQKSCRKVFGNEVDELPVYIATNSKTMAKNCTARAADLDIEATYIDTGLSENDMHTAYSRNADLAAVNAFLDFLLLLDATIVVATSSSFSASASDIKGLNCHHDFAGMTMMRFRVCLPNEC